MKIRMLAAAAMVAVSVGAHANTTFSDNFDADAQGLSVVPTNWAVSGDGTVDIIGTGFYDEIPGHGNYVDLDGSNGAAGKLSTTVSFDAGTYTATFALGGNHRDGTTDDVTVKLGNVTETFSIGPQDDFTQYSITATSTGNPLTLSFQDGRDGNVGALLDDVVVASPVPEPANIALMMAGLFALGLSARRRRG